MDTQSQLESHERECAIRYEMIHSKLAQLDKRMWRLEAMIMVSTASLIGLSILLITQL